MRVREGGGLWVVWDWRMGSERGGMMEFMGKRRAQIGELGQVAVVSENRYHESSREIDKENVFRTWKTSHLLCRLVPN